MEVDVRISFYVSVDLVLDLQLDGLRRVTSPELRADSYPSMLDSNICHTRRLSNLPLSP